MHEREGSSYALIQRSLAELKTSFTGVCVLDQRAPNHPHDDRVTKFVFLDKGKVNSLYFLSDIEEIDLGEVIRGEDPITVLERRTERIASTYRNDDKTIKAVKNLVEARGLQTISAAYIQMASDGKKRTVVGMPDILSTSRGLEDSLRICASFLLISPEASVLSPFKRTMAQARY